MKNATKTTATPTTSYAMWCEGIRTSPVHAKKRVRIAYGTETYGAWECGVTPDDYLRSLPAITGRYPW